MIIISEDKILLSHSRVQGFFFIKPLNHYVKVSHSLVNVIGSFSTCNIIFHIIPLPEKIIPTCCNHTTHLKYCDA